MSLLFVDGFDHYVTNEITRKWTDTLAITIASTTPRRSTSKYLSVYPGYAIKRFASGTTFVVGFGMYLTGTFTGGTLVEFLNAAGTQCALALNADGSVSIKRSTTVLGTSAAGIFVPNLWMYLEVKVFVDDTTGTYEVKRNGTTILSGTGADTKFQATTGVIDIKLSGGGIGTLFDDLYIDDANFLGDCRIDTLMPNGVGATTEWTPSAGSNYQNVDDSGDMDDDTTYNSEDVAGQIDTFVFPDIEATGGTIHAVVKNIAVRKDDAGTRDIKGVTRQSTTNYSSAAVFSVADNYAVAQFIEQSQPGASGGWDETTLNAAEFGVEMDA